MSTVITREKQEEMNAYQHVLTSGAAHSYDLKATLTTRRRVTIATMAAPIAIAWSSHPAHLAAHAVSATEFEVASLRPRPAQKPDVGGRLKARARPGAASIPVESRDRSRLQSKPHIL
jgi:hypothetical protein